MPSSRILIASNTLTSSAASVTFSSIPSTYTDLVLKMSVRNGIAGSRNTFVLTLNGSTANFSRTNIGVDGGSVYSNRSTNSQFNDIAGSTATSNTFANVEMYIPSYLASQNKPISNIAANENNSTTEYLIAANAGLWSNTAAITSIAIGGNGNDFVSGSTFWLYGLKNS